MKRTALRRRTAVKPKRATPRRALNRCSAFLAWIRTLPCCVPPVLEHLPMVEAAHVHTRRNGGDVANAIPLCPSHHREQHLIGVRSFARKYGLDLEALARRYWEDYLAELLLSGRSPGDVGGTP